MKNKFSISLHAFKQIINKFDDETSLQKTSLLNTLKKIALTTNKNLLEYHDCLLFLCAYPNNIKIHGQAIKELNRITIYLKHTDHSKKLLLENEGLPFVNTVTSFTPDFLNWLLLHPGIKIQFDSFNNPSLSLNEVLNITLPSFLKPETTAGLSNEELLQLLAVKPHHYLSFLLNQAEQLKGWPLVKDILMEKLDVYVKLLPKNALFSRTYNRLPVDRIFYHKNLLKQFDHKQLLGEPLPKKHLINHAEKKLLIQVIKNSMALTTRETDPITYMQEDSIRLYKLERGINVAIYGMIPQRQLPLESYIGFTLFKNGFPVSYGGAWIFGRRGRFGMNIFESFRGGESGYVMFQLLRVYNQVLNISFFDIEPYQYGLDNPDGIASAAFWFYYRYGFRPLNRQLLKLSGNEYKKIRNQKNYRSSEKILTRFTQSNIALNLGKSTPAQVQDIFNKTKSFIKKNYQNNASKAEQDAIELFCKKIKLNILSLNEDEKNVLTEVALWAMVMNITNRSQIKIMKKMLYSKPQDVYAYQQLLLDFFSCPSL